MKRDRKNIRKPVFESWELIWLFKKLKITINSLIQNKLKLNLKIKFNSLLSTSTVQTVNSV